jgi:hypothetical protein
VSAAASTSNPGACGGCLSFGQGHLRHNDQIPRVQGRWAQFIEWLPANLAGVVLKPPMAVEKEPATRLQGAWTNLFGHNGPIDAGLSGIGEAKSCRKE